MTTPRRDPSTRGRRGSRGWAGAGWRRGWRRSCSHGRAHRGFDASALVPLKLSNPVLTFLIGWALGSWNTHLPPPRSRLTRHGRVAHRRPESGPLGRNTPLHAHKKPGFGLRVSSFLFVWAPSRLLISFLISYIIKHQNRTFEFLQPSGCKN